MYFQAIQLALDARDSEREKTAVLIRELCPAVLSRDAVALGMTRLLAQAEVGSQTLLTPSHHHVVI